MGRTRRSVQVPGAPEPLSAADRERAFVWNFGKRLSRFRTDSELSSLNADPRGCVGVSPLLRVAVGAGLWAADRSGGLVDPTLVRALEHSGYDRSLDGVEPASLEEALSQAPPRGPAKPDPAAMWRRVVIDDLAATITLPPGVTLDTGGTGKGLCAHAVASRLAGYTRFVVDCGGDIGVGSARAGDGGQGAGSPGRQARCDAPARAHRAWRRLPRSRFTAWHCSATRG